MKNNEFFIRATIILVLSSLISCDGEDEKGKKNGYTTTIKATAPDQVLVLNDPVIEGATVVLYNSENDYLGQLNTVAQGTTNANGEFQTVDEVEKAYWV